MKLYHALLHAAPGTVCEIIATGQALWLYNSRGHGDTEDTFIWVEGRLHNHEDRKTFLIKTPMGLVTHEYENEDEITMRFEGYLTLI